MTSTVWQSDSVWWILARMFDPVVDRRMHAVYRSKGAVNQVLGDGIMALFEAPLPHTDEPRPFSFQLGNE
jgi:class 3 adenylate cyclase